MNDIPAALLLDRQQFETELRGNILPFWAGCTLDPANRGFYGAISNDLHVHNEVVRSAVLCSRILWTFSRAARLYDEESYLYTADWAMDYLVRRFWDEQHHGIYWSLDRHGRPVNDRKHTYAQAFAIYGLSEYHRTTGDAAALALARQLFELVEAHTFDPLYGGNIECRARDWSPLVDMRLSSKEIDSAKSTNTLLHLMEAYTALFFNRPDESLRARLEGLVRLFLEKIIDLPAGHQRLFFDERWRSLSGVISFGHDIEASWLLVEAAEMLGDPALLERARAAALALAQAVYDQALDPQGCLTYELAPGGQREETRHWWVHAEAVVGFYNAYLLSGQPAFARAAGQVWEYIQAHFVDRQHGDWFKLLNPQGQPYQRHYKVGPWECPYHQSRMCFEMVRRLES